MVTLGFDSFDPIQNLGTLGLFVGLYFAKLGAFLVFVLPWVTLTGRGRNLYQKLKSQLFFSEVILIFIEGYIEFLIVLNLHNLRPDEAATTDKLIVWVIGLISVGFLPTILTWTGLQKASRFKEPEFQERWGALFEGIRASERSKRLFYFFFVLRRILFVQTAFMLMKTPGL